jgi:hypothetical protein
MIIPPPSAYLLALNQTKKNAANGRKDDPVFPGVITIYEKGWEDAPKLSSSELLDDAEALTAARQRFGILDGQHRVGAMRIMHNAGGLRDPVVVEVYKMESEVEVKGRTHAAKTPYPSPHLQPRPRPRPQRHNATALTPILR